MKKLYYKSKIQQTFYNIKKKKKLPNSHHPKNNIINYFSNLNYKKKYNSVTIIFQII